MASHEHRSRVSRPEIGKSKSTKVYAPSEVEVNNMTQDVNVAHTHHLESYLSFDDRHAVYKPLLVYIDSSFAVPVDTRGKAVLEIGSAAGAFLRWLKDTCRYEFGEMKGVDPDEAAGAYSPEGTFVPGSALNLPFEDDSFDFVFMVSVLHHLLGRSLKHTKNNWNVALAEACRVTKPDGHVLVHEGLAVRHRASQSAIFLLTSLLARICVGIPLFHLEVGEKLAFLTPGDLSTLVRSMEPTDLVLFSTGKRPWGREFCDAPGLGQVWRFLTCNAVAVLNVKKSADLGSVFPAQVYTQ